MNVIVGGRHGGKGQVLRWHVGEESHVLSYLMCVVKDGREMKDHIFELLYIFTGVETGMKKKKDDDKRDV